MSITHIASRVALGTIKRIFLALLYGGVGAAVAVVIIAVRYLDNRPDLNVWHTADLDTEFTQQSNIETFNEYLDLEDELFAQLNTNVYDSIDVADQRKLNRYHRGSLADPEQWKTNWNRSFEFKNQKPTIGILLLHGMSDSPYSLRNLGTQLHEEGAYVVGLRIPGHGTAPVGLVDVTWQDMAAAVSLAMQHLHDQMDGAPLYIIGYSNGAALAVQYTLKSLDDHSLPSVSGLVLLSPEIGVSKLAGLAVWQERMGHLIGFEKLAWNSILPEYDAYKYGSFALNAGKQAHLLTNEIQAEITRISSGDALQRMPRILAFQSVVDATVTAPALVAGLFDRLPKAQHELVLYDINRFSEIEPILTSNPTQWIDTLLKDREVDYAVTLITNQDQESTAVVARTRTPPNDSLSECRLDAKWPGSVYSLSHVALPFAPNDPLYGSFDYEDAPELQLGNISLRGERGVLQIPAADLMRLRWNPFYAYQESRILNFLNMPEKSESRCIK